MYIHRSSESSLKEWRAYTLLFVAFIALTNTIVSLYPAWRASRLAPLDSMRRVG